MARKHKYNAKKAEVDGIQFDSKVEAEYYQHLKELQEAGEVDDFSLQPVFELQPKFRKGGKLWRPIKYKADFLVSWQDGTTQVIDIKGFETADFKLKKKLFEYKYDYSLTLICKAPKYLLPRKWIELDELKKIRKERKKQKGSK